MRETKELEELLDAAVELAEGAGRVLREAFDASARGGELVVDHKGPIDLVTEADRAAETFLLQGIARDFPSHAIWAEESGRGAQEGPYRWILDPLDGTVNFAHGVPHFAVLIAVQERRGDTYDTVLSVAFDPMRREQFLATRGGGAWGNRRPLRVSRTARLLDAVLATGFAYDRLFKDDDNHREFCRLNLLSQGVRRFGSAGLDLAYVAAGRVDGFWETGLKVWDVAGGALLIEEAGGTVTGFAGEPFDLPSGAVCASNGRVHQAMLAALASSRDLPAASREGLKAHLPADVSPRSGS